jgi:beta-lactamase regulating signal transducer with metallopeptidase domain
MATSAALFGWLTVRWWQIARKVRVSGVSERLTSIGAAAQKGLGIRNPVPVRMTANSMSPAVCGLFHPTILIPESLANSFSVEQLRAVLLHELIHVRRFDVWANVWQALLQITYWWHPLVWLANARIRRVREEAVDDAVMLTLRDDAESYAPTLLEVAKLSLNRPLTSLGLVGILESRHSLRQRIERLLDFRPPRHSGPTLASTLGILAFSAIAVPMGDAPAAKETASTPVPATAPASDQQTNSPAFVIESHF